MSTMTDDLPIAQRARRAVQKSINSAALLYSDKNKAFHRVPKSPLATLGKVLMVLGNMVEL